MGDFFTVVDDPLNQRVILYRASEPSGECVWLESDPSGVDALPVPEAIEKTGLGSGLTSKAGYILPYNDANSLRFSTDLPTTKSIAQGTPTDVTVAVSGGTLPYTYAWTKNGDPLSVVAATIHFTAVPADAGTYVVTVTDSIGLVITSKSMVLTVTTP
jgi:hypothetical protein